MVNRKQIFTIVSIIVFVVLVGVGVYFYEGVGMRNSHYIKLDLGPSVEFLTDSDNIINTVYPCNEDAKIVIAGENFKDLDIKEAVNKFLLLCVKTGYIDVTKSDNAVQISVSSGFTQVLENKIYATCNKFFQDNEIYAVIAESDADLALFRQKKEKHVMSIEKLVIINSILEKTNEYNFEQLNKKNESELIDLLEDLHAMNNNDILLEQYGSQKNNLIEENFDKFNAHLSAITNESKREFNSKYDKYKKKETNKYESDFAKALEEKKQN